MIDKYYKSEPLGIKTREILEKYKLILDIFSKLAYKQVLLL